MTHEDYEEINRLHPHTVMPPTNYDRYSDATPYEETRVHLSNCADTDYINASFLTYKNCKFIACQSPLPNTVDHFWHMLVEQRISLIVMLVSVERKRCEQYWPEPGFEITSNDRCTIRTRSDGSKNGSFKIKEIMQQQKGSFMHRVFEIWTEGISWECEHWQYLEWPDHGAPSTTKDIYQFIRANINQHSNIVVHCSAGCGRTGTFCTIWTALYENITSLKELARVIAIFKHQRNLKYTVETKPQYDFILRTLGITNN